MINDYKVKRVCKDDISLIENYDKAMADNDRMWDCHHRLETHKYKDRSRAEWVRRDENVSREMLQTFDVYYNRPASELIFLTRQEHSNLHKGFLGHKHSEETKRKNGEAHKGQIPWNKGKTGVYSEETLKKISEAGKGRKKSEETLRKLSNSLRGKHPTEETKQKIANSLKGKKFTEERKQKLREAWIRRKARKQ